MPPTTTDSDIAEIKIEHATVHAIGALFAAVAMNRSAISLATELAVKSADLAAIRLLARDLNRMTDTIQARRQPMPAPRPRLDS